MKRFWQFIGIVLILVVLAGLGIYAFTPREKLFSYVAPKLSLIRISNLQINNDQATLQLQLQATSPLLPVYISKLHYDFKLFNQSVCQGNHSFTNKQNGKVQLINLPIQLNYAQALSLLQRQLVDSTPVNADFNLTCRIPLLGNRSIQKLEALPLKIPVLLAPEIISLTTEEIGFQHLQVVLTVKINNPSTYDYYLRNLSLRAQFTEYQAEAGNLPQDYLIKANQATPIKIVSTKAIEKPSKNAFFQPNTTLGYKLNTAMVLEPVDVPINKITYQATQSGSVTIPPKI